MKPDQGLALPPFFYTDESRDKSVCLPSGICCEEFISPVARPLKSVALANQGMALCICHREGVNWCWQLVASLPLVCHLNELRTN